MIEYKKVKVKIQEVIDSLEKQNENVVSFSANKKWLALPLEIRRELERNVWCVNCIDVVQIENYTVKDFSTGMVLEGTCKKCGADVARVID